MPATDWMGEADDQSTRRLSDLPTLPDNKKIHVYSQPVEGKKLLSIFINEKTNKIFIFLSLLPRQTDSLIKVLKNICPTTRLSIKVFLCSS